MILPDTPLVELPDVEGPLLLKLEVQVTGKLKNYKK